MNQVPYSTQSAAFVASEQSFPPQVLNEGRRVLVDRFACQIACAPLPWSKAFRNAVCSLGTADEVTIVYYGDRLALDEAAFLNSAFGHGNEFDDMHPRSSTNAGSVVVPPVPALAEKRQLPGAKALGSIVLGAEVMIRIATAVSPHLHNRGHHTPRSRHIVGNAAAYQLETPQ